MRHSLQMQLRQIELEHSREIHAPSDQDRGSVNLEGTLETLAQRQKVEPAIDKSGFRTIGVREGSRR